MHTAHARAREKGHPAALQPCAQRTHLCKRACTVVLDLIVAQVQLPHLCALLHSAGSISTHHAHVESHTQHTTHVEDGASIRPTLHFCDLPRSAGTGRRDAQSPVSTHASNTCIVMRGRTSIYGTTAHEHGGGALSTNSVPNPLVLFAVDGQEGWMGRKATAAMPGPFLQQGC